MAEIIYIPKKFIEKAREIGIDVETLIMNTLTEKLNINPNEEVNAHIELANTFFKEGLQLIERDPMQASEKFYKVAEECIKALAISRNLEEARESKIKGRWTLKLLDMAAKNSQN